MIGALWSNPNWDDDKETRKNAIQDIEENYREALKIVMGKRRPPEKEEALTDEDAANPFLAPAIKATREIEAPSNADGTVEGNITAEDLATLDQ